MNIEETSNVLLDNEYQFTPIPEIESVRKVPAPSSKPIPAPGVPIPSVQRPTVSQPVAQISRPNAVSVPVSHPAAIVSSVQSVRIPAPVSTPTPAPIAPVEEVEEEPTEEEITEEAIDDPITEYVGEEDTEEAVEGDDEEMTEEETQNIEHDASVEESQIENLLDTKLQTDVQKKFGELFFTTKKIYELKNIEDSFDIIGANNDKVFISYRFLLDETDEPKLLITKIEQDKETEEEVVNELRLTFVEEASSLEIVINDTLLFDEAQDLTDDSKKKMQVIDKLNKFIFLASEELRKTEKEIKEKEE